MHCTGELYSSACQMSWVEQKGHSRDIMMLGCSSLLARLHSDMTCSFIFESTAPLSAERQAPAGCCPGCTSSCLAADGYRFAAQRCHMECSGGPIPSSWAQLDVWSALSAHLPCRDAENALESFDVDKQIQLTCYLLYSLASY